MKKKYSYLLICLFLISSKIVSGQSLNATLLELKFSNDGYPERFTKVENGFFFSSEDDQLWFSDGTDENTYLVKDFDSGLYDDISSLTPAGTKVFFVAENGRDNRELWVSDGTNEGTIQLTDRSVGSGTENIYDIIEFNGKIYFGAHSEVYGNELWVSNGTPSGTFVLKDIAENTTNSNPRDFYIFNNTLFFKAYTEQFNTELWTSDGTEQGTVLFKDINEGTLGGMSSSQGYRTFDHNLYFFANNGTNGTELWKSDGTSEGTQLLKDIRLGNNSSNNGIMIGAVLNDKLIFTANDGINGIELWKTDGTLAGTSIFKDINTGLESGFLYDEVLKLAGDKIFFTATDGGEQFGLWVSDGTDQGTIFLNSTTPELLAVDDSGAFVVYFAYKENSGNVLWKSDGTKNGTVVISEEMKLTNISVSDQSFLAYDNRIFFNGKNEVNGNEMWVTNGTPEGTRLFFDVNHSWGVAPSLLKSVGDRLFFRGNQYGSYGLCTSDGTIEGTKYLEGQNIDKNSSFADFNGKLAASAHDGTHGFELWMSDGTHAETKMIKDINLGKDGSMSEYQEFSVIQDKLYFSANDGVHGFELWTSDGTESGTYMIKDLRTGGSNYHSYPLDFVELNGSIYFHARSNSGDAIWKSDGTESGTQIVQTLNDIRELRTVNNKLLIIAETSGTSYGPHDLWVSDGTAQGTQHLKSFGDNIDSDILFMTILNNELYFVAKSPDSFRKAIYKSDGTVKGTKLLYDGINHNPPDIDIDDIMTCGNYVYFAIQEGYGANKELWRTDGTVEGTLMVAGPDTQDFSFFRNMTCFDGYLLYLAESSANNIWVTNGQPNEAVQLDIEISNGLNFQEYDNIGYMETNGDKLYFEARTDISGSEIYVSTPDFSSLHVDDNGFAETSNTKGLVSIYPNPTSEIIKIKSMRETSILSFELFDLFGKKLIKQENKSLSSEMTYNVGKLLQGIYLMRVNFLNGNNESAKLIIID